MGNNIAEESFDVGTSYESTIWGEVFQALCLPVTSGNEVIPVVRVVGGVIDIVFELADEFSNSLSFSSVSVIFLTKRIS